MTDPPGMKQGLDCDLPPGMGQLPSCLLICELPQQDPGHLQVRMFPEISLQALVLLLLLLLALSLRGR